MIEVSFDSYYKNCAQLLFNNGFKSFHVDFGDHKLIGRELDCWNKVNFLKSLGKEMRLTAHIMSMSGNHKLSVEKITDKCLEAGFEIIYIHSRSFSDISNLFRFKEKFFNKLNHVFGLVSELNDKKNYELINFINDNNVQNILQMGVPIGKGAQRFQWQAINQIKEISLDCPFLSTIELDGGLTFDIINNIKNVKVNRFAGWSIISDPDPKTVLVKAQEVKSII